MPVLWFEGSVIEVREMTLNTKQFFIRIEADDIFQFLPGQFVTFDLPIGDKRLQRWRSYSIANHPDGSNVLELCIVRSEDGQGTEYFFEEVEVGTKLKFKGPDGGFILPTDLDIEMIMIATGTGVAPFRSMLSHVKHQKLDFNKIHLIFGTRNKSGLLYRDEFLEFEKDYPNFKYSCALSREVEPGMYHGYLHDIYMEAYNDVSPKRHFYICGWSHMIDEAVANLFVKLGYDKSQIHYELYG